jgi:transcriptional regulator with XRE-family HTH domain
MKMEETRDRIREVRGRLRLTQGKFAARMGVKQNTWSNIELGTNPCSDRYINLVCLTFNVREEWLRHGRGEIFDPTPKPPPESFLGNNGKLLSPDTVELITIYEELLPLNQDAVLTFADTTLQSQRNTIKAMGNTDGSETEKGEIPA